MSIDKDWKERFDEKFGFLPFNEDEPPIYIVKGEALDERAFKEQLKNGVIKVSNVDAISVADNKNLRQEIKSFIEHLLEEREK